MFYWICYVVFPKGFWVEKKVSGLLKTSAMSLAPDESQKA